MLWSPKTWPAMIIFTVSVPVYFPVSAWETGRHPCGTQRFSALFNPYCMQYVHLLPSEGKNIDFAQIVLLGQKIMGHSMNYSTQA